MELHQLRYFLAVVDEGTFSAAAHAVRISQSGVSTQIQKLERELGVALIDRTPRRVTPTAAGARLVPYARAAVAAVEDVRGAANDIRGLVVGSLRVAVVAGLTWPPLFDALAAIRRAHPGIDLLLHEGTSADLVTGVRDGQTDVAVVAWSGDPPAGVSCMVAVDDALVVVVPTGHPWATRDSIRPDELAEAEVIALPVGSGSRAALDATLARAGAPGEPRWEVSSPAHIRMLAQRDLGVGVVSESTAAGWPELVVVPVDDLQARSRLGIAWSRRPSHAARALLDRLLDRLPGAAGQA